MPHIVIEHDSQTTNEVDLKALAQTLHDTLAAQETVKLEALKTRTIEVDNTIIGAGENNQMIHVNVLLLTGRSVELKETMCAALFEAAQSFLADKKLSLTVNIDELGVYKKL